MGKSSKTQTPTPMDTSGVGAQQAGQNQEVWNQNLAASRPNQTNPYGSLTWEQDPTTGAWTQNVGLSEPQQGIFDQQQQNQAGIANAAGGLLGGLDTSQIKLNNNIPQVGQYNQQATDLYNQLAAPGLKQSEDAQRARAAAMGVPEFGSRAGTTLNQQLADQTSRSGMMGAQAGIAQGNTMFGQGIQANQQENQNILNERSANLGQLSGLMGLQQTAGNPQFQSVGQTPQLGNVDYTNLAQQAYNQQLNSTNAANADQAASNQSKQQAVGTAVSVAAMVF